MFPRPAGLVVVLFASLAGFGLAGCTSTPTDALTIAATPPAQPVPSNTAQAADASPPVVGEPAPLDGATSQGPNAVADRQAQEPTIATTYAPPETSSGARQTGQYPKFGHAPRAQTEQFSPDQADQMRAEMNAVSKRHKAKGAATAQEQYRDEIAAMKKLIAEQKKKREIQSTY